MKRIIFIVLCVFAVSVVPVAAQDAPALHVVATMTIIADVAHNVGGDLVDVTSIIPPETDVHSYAPTPGDVARIADADLVLMNGIFLEQGLIEIIEENAASDPITVSNGVPVLNFVAPDSDAGGAAGENLEVTEVSGEQGAQIIGVLGENVECAPGEVNNEGEEEEGNCDPHVWTDPANVIIWTQNIAAAFSAADPDNATTYEANAAAYIEQVEALQAEIDAQLETLPVERRILVTNHDFLGYFAHAYQFEIVGAVIPSITTLAEVSPQDLADLVDTIRVQNVPAIFAEISANTELAETVSDEIGFDVEVVVLYSDALSAEDGPAATYLDYVRYNVNTIVSALAD